MGADDNGTQAPTLDVLFSPSSCCTLCSLPSALRLLPLHGMWSFTSVSSIFFFFFTPLGVKKNVELLLVLLSLLLLKILFL